MSRISAFAQGYGVGRQMVQDYRDEKKRREIEQVAEAKPEESKGFTAEQGDQLRAAAESGQYDIGTDESGNYTVTPKSDPSQVGVIKQQGVTDFLGNRTAGSMAPEQVQAARTRAMAGVLMKNGDTTGGMRMEQQATEAERGSQRFTWEQNRARREEEGAQREDAWRTGRDQLLQESNFGRLQRENAAANTKYEQDLADYKARVAKGERGLVEPTAPRARDYGLAQALHDQMAVAAHDVQYGKGNVEGLARLAQMRKQLDDEGYVRTLKSAQSGAPIDQVLKTFNENGKVQVKPEDVVSDKMVDRGNGVKSREITFKGSDGKTHTIDTLSELDAYGQADKLIDRVFKANADTRDGRRTDASVAHTIAQTGVLNQNLDEKKELNTIRTDISSAIESGDQDAIAKGRAKLLSYMSSGKSGMQGMSPEERKANFYLASGLAKDMTEAARMAHEKVQTSAKDDYMTLMKPNNMGITPSAEQVDSIMEALHGNDWKQRVRGSGNQAAAPKPADQATAHSQAAAAIKGGADKAAVNARLKQWGYQPLP